MTSTGLVCVACGTQLPSDSKFCSKCGTPVGLQHNPAEYKQVTVLFADVVHSMDIAAAVGGAAARGVSQPVNIIGGKVDVPPGPAFRRP